MNILLEYQHYPVCSGRYVREAFEEMPGIDVRSAGPSTGNMIWGVIVDQAHYQKTFNIDDWRPDLIIVMDSHPFYLSNDTPSAYLFPEAPVVVYGVDNHVRDYLYRTPQRKIEHYFFGHAWPSVIDMRADNITWLPCGYSPEVCTPSSIPWEDREYDIAIAGVLYPQRETLVRKAVEAGCKVWAGLAIYSKYRAVYHNARISLNWSASFDVPQRLFETVAMGCAFVTDPLPDLQGLTIAQAAPGRIYQTTAPTFMTTIRIALDRGVPEMEADALFAHTWQSRLSVILAWWSERYG